MEVLALLVLSIVPVESGPFEERCDCLLYEMVYDDNGTNFLIQLCPMDWNPHHERWEYWGFRVQNPMQSLRPERDWLKGGYVVRWVEGDVMRVIRADSMVEHHTQTDSELLARTVQPVEKRRGFLKCDPSKPSP